MNNTASSPELENPIAVRHVPEESAFVLFDGDEPIGRVEYARDGATVDLHHTDVDAQYSGRGLAGRVVRTAADFFAAEAESAGESSADASARLRLVATCPYARGWLSRHPDEYRSILTPAASES